MGFVANRHTPFFAAIAFFFVVKSPRTVYMKKTPQIRACVRGYMQKSFRAEVDTLRRSQVVVAKRFSDVWKP
jgi:hypothetical protein